MKNDMDKIEKMLSEFDELETKYDAIPDTDEEKKNQLVQDMFKLTIETAKQLKKEYDEMQKKHNDD